jgi:hypothetical protein
MRASVSAVVVLALLASPALAEDIRVVNVGDTPIYRLYAWPSDLIPRTTSLIVFPMRPLDITRVVIDNNWSDCQFTFQIDRNDPSKRRRTNYKKVPLTVVDANICKGASGPIKLR